MKTVIYFCFILVLFAIVSGQVTDTMKFMGDQVEVICVRPDIEESVSFEATIPQGWKRNPYFGTVVYQPQNADDYYEPPNIEFQALCEGECRAEAIPGNIENYINRLKEGWKTLATGDPELDKLGAIVDVITEEKSDSQWLLEVKLTYPEGVSSAMYPPRYYIYRFLHNGQDPFFLFIKGIVPIELADEFLSDVYASCVSTVKF